MAAYIDVGNTNIKIMDERMTLHSFPTTGFDPRSTRDVLIGCDAVVVSGVVPDMINELGLYLQSIGKKFGLINNRSKFSFKHNVDGVGTDRLIAVEGGITLLDPPFVVIDAGTAITVDFVIKQDGVNVYKGGVIIPGFELCFKALNDYTFMLPRLKPISPKGSYGTDTMNAMNCGICLTIASGVKHIISASRESFGLSDMKVLVTGGAGKFLGELLEMKYEYVDNLIFRGMMNIHNNRGA